MAYPDLWEAFVGRYDMQGVKTLLIPALEKGWTIQSSDLTGAGQPFQINAATHTITLDTVDNSRFWSAFDESVTVDTMAMALHSALLDPRVSNGPRFPNTEEPADATQIAQSASDPEAKGSLAKISAATVDSLVRSGQAQRTSDGKFVLVTDAVGDAVYRILLEYHSAAKAMGGRAGHVPAHAAFYSAVQIWSDGGLGAGSESVTQIVDRLRDTVQVYDGKQMSQADYYETRYNANLSDQHTIAMMDGLATAGEVALQVAKVVPVVGTGLTILEAAQDGKFDWKDAKDIGLSALGDAATFATFGLGAVAKAANGAKVVGGTAKLVALGRGVLGANAAAQVGDAAFNLVQAINNAKEKGALSTAGSVGLVFLQLLGAKNDMVQALRGARLPASALSKADDVAHAADDLADTKGPLIHLPTLQDTCFIPGTPIRTPLGSKPIDSLRQGDFIMARAEEEPDGDISPRMVEAVFKLAGPVLEIRAGGQVIGTTGEHPFYVQDEGWRRARELKPGDVLAGERGAGVPVESVIDTGRISDVYNIRVADFRTYFVGDVDWGFSVWVHNTYSVKPSDGKFQVVNAKGKPVSGGKLYDTIGEAEAAAKEWADRAKTGNVVGTAADAAPVKAPEGGHLAEFTLSGPKGGILKKGDAVSGVDFKVKSGLHLTFPEQSWYGHSEGKTIAGLIESGMMKPGRNLGFLGELPPCSSCQNLMKWASETFKMEISYEDFAGKFWAWKDGALLTKP